MSLKHDVELADTREILRLERERRQEREAQRLRMQFANRGLSEDVLMLPEWQPLIRRVGESVDDSFPDRLAHIRAVVLDVISARTRPRHPVSPTFSLTSYTTEPGSSPVGGHAAGLRRSHHAN